MSQTNPRGLVYRCPLCGAEISVVGTRMRGFSPRCCNTDMVLLPRRLAFYHCPLCGAEIAVVKPGSGPFVPRCCNEDMVPIAA